MGETKRSTTVHFRYHIGEADAGLLDTARTKREAFDIAERWAKELPGVTVFDSMAQWGCAQVWYLHQLGWWRVKERRGGEDA